MQPIVWTNPFAFRTHVHVEGREKVGMPIGYLTQCGFPVFYGVMWQLLHLDPALPRPARLSPAEELFYRVI